MAGSLRIPRRGRKCPSGANRRPGPPGAAAGAIDDAWFGLARAELLEGAKGAAGRRHALPCSDEALDSGSAWTEGLAYASGAGHPSKFSGQPDPLAGIFPLQLADRVAAGQPTRWRSPCRPRCPSCWISSTASPGVPPPGDRPLAPGTGERDRPGLAGLPRQSTGRQGLPQVARIGPAAAGGEELLVDPDSPLLLRRVDPLLGSRR